MSGFEFSILGPVEATEGSGALPLGGPRQRALLAYLLLHANKVVASDRLVDELWESPPGDAHAALQNQVSRLRKVLDDRLSTRPPGYVLRVEPGELDLDRFRTVVAEAGSISDLGERSRCLREADALFRGAPLAGVEAPFAAGEIVALEELRLAALEARVDADLERGRHAELVPELGGLVAHHPLRERLRGQHILALYRSGRQAEALEAYRDTRRMLDEQLGLEPSPALRELEHAILTQDPALAATPVAVAVEAPTSPRPAAAPRRRPRLLLIAAVAGGVVLMLAGGAAAVLLTRSGDTPRANAAAPGPAAHPAAKKKHVAAVVKRTTKKPHAARPVAKVRSTTVVVHVSSPVAVSHRARKVPVTRPVVPTTPAKKTAPAATTTTHATTTTPATKAAPTPTDTRTLTDDFSETTPNTRLWNVTGNGSGWTWALQNGRLETTIPADAQQSGNYSMVGLGWASQCRFDGDFDERIDYQLLEWPYEVGGHVQLSAWIFPSPNASAARQSTQGGEGYSGNIGQNWNVVDTSDTHGTLRLARVGGVDTAYYLSGGKWIVLNSQQAPGRVQLGIEVFGANDWTHQQIRVAFDNFSVTAPSIVCP